MDYEILLNHFVVSKLNLSIAESTVRSVTETQLTISVSASLEGLAKRTLNIRAFGRQAGCNFAVLWLRSRFDHVIACANDSRHTRAETHRQPMRQLIMLETGQNQTTRQAMATLCITLQRTSYDTQRYAL